MPDTFFHCTTSTSTTEKGKEDLMGRSQPLREPGELNNNCAPSFSDSPKTQCQALVAHGPGLLENKWNIACSFLKLRQVREKESKRKWSSDQYFLTCTSSTVLDPELFEVYRKSPTDFKWIWFRAQRRRKKHMVRQKAHWHHGSVRMHRALPGAMCVYQMFPFLGLPLRHVLYSRTQWKDLKYCLICIYLTKNTSVLPEDLWVK